MKPDALQWMLVCELVNAHPETLTIEELRRQHPDFDVEETIARLLIDGLAVRFGDWVKASEPAARFDQLARFAQSGGVRGTFHRAA
jgi:hypothetical protein